MSDKVYIFFGLLFYTQHVFTEDNYVYDDTVNAVAKGTRLVGADKAEVKDIPFLVGYNNDENANKLHCTGSLISPSWVLSAAHCILVIVETEEIPGCVETTTSKGTFETKDKRVVKCEYDEEKNVKVDVISPGLMAYLGLKDFYNPSDVESGQKINIDFYKLNFQTYRGNTSYGKFGGFDITLLHLATPADAAYGTACLPSLNFADTERKVSLAGYGYFYRKPCLTDEYGASKYHYCSNPCDADSSPPQEALCDQFFANSAAQELGNFTDIILVGPDNAQTYCYANKSRNPESIYGWCRVTDDASKIGVLEEADSWGFCGRDCHEDTEEQSKGTLRRVDDVDILEENMCERYLQVTLEEGEVEVKPRILCVGNIIDINIEAFNVAGDTFTKADSSQIHHKSELDPGSHMYVVSAGVCNGDSGGPAFIKSEEMDKYVVLGVTSRGSGNLGSCGGINNPTHYVRVKKLTKWIRKMLDSDATDLCYADK